MNWTEDETLCNMIWFHSFKLIMSYPLFRLAACESEITPLSTYSAHWRGKKQLIINLCLPAGELHPLDPAPRGLLHVVCVFLLLLNPPSL